MTTRLVVVIAGFLAGCAAPLVSLSPWGTSNTLECSLNRFERLGYQVSLGEPGSPWHHAVRERGGSGEQAWIRVVDDRRGAAWLDIRVTSWGQEWQAPRADGDLRPFIFRGLGGQGQEDVQTVRDACEGPRSTRAGEGLP